ncbi:outer membrane autotransporter protein [Ochrobactrum daejeonense]|uniref:Outer membrane autotransporter protein n=1 Tax=Brucella daejeonensis TaxID=659015 RepID=A0A7W9EPV6_9HYPH|nr:autotransporter outer membrane beta-barrel domain-containing protein [Brucella daejeonensis]MBB5704191.1 outer membrane autotransporter protein [Brucella daejeonensis]
MLTISNGGAVSTGAETVLGFSATRIGQIEVKDAGSTLTVGTYLHVGEAGTGWLIIKDGGVVDVQAGMIIAAQTGSVGELDIGYGAAPGTLKTDSVTFGAGTGAINFDHTDNNYIFDPSISGPGTINQKAGTTVLTGDNSGFTGTLNINGGVLSASAENNLGASSGTLHFDGGTLQATEHMNLVRDVTLTSAGGTISVDSGKIVNIGNVIANDGAADGSFTKSGDGTLVMFAANTYTGGTTVSGGVLKLGDGMVDGSIVGDIALSGGDLVVNNLGATALDGDISGTGSLTQIGPGTLTLSGNNDYSGGTNLSAGVISVEQDDNLGTGALYFNGGTLAVTGTHFNSLTNAIDWGAGGGTFDIADANNNFEVSGVFSDSGDLTKSGAGTLSLSGDSSSFSGNTNVNEGTLLLNGGLLGDNAGSQTVNVASGAALGGDGTIGGATTIADGGSLFGQSGQQLAFGQGLTLDNNSQVDVSLNGGPSTQALFDVTGDLTIGGTFNIDQDSVMGVGVYRIFGYTGTLTDNGMTIGGVPTGDDASNFELQTSIDHEVNLVNNAGRDFFFWDGNGPGDDGIIQGGDGTWDGTNTNWTGLDGSANSNWRNDSFAVFGNDPGTGQSGGNVVIDAGFTPSVNGMQFMNTGYRLSGSPITLGGTGDPVIIVGDGAADSANITAEINSVIEGADGLYKSGLGNLILTGANTYTGDTTVNEGTLTLGDGGSIDASSDIILANTRYGHGNLVIDKDQAFTLANAISGIGAVVKDGTGTTTFAGDNTFTGGLTVKGGTAQAGIANTAFGSGNVTVNGGATLDLADFNETVGSLIGKTSGDGNIDLGSGTLTLNQNLHGDFSGTISGTGGLTKNGDGDLVLYGANDYSGDTTVNKGTLAQGAAGGFSGASSYTVANGASLELGGFDTTMAALSNGGDVTFGGTGGAVLNVSGDYHGDGGTLHMSAVLGGDNSLTDRMNVGGDTSGNSKIDITNRKGFGEKTNNGIEIIDVGGNSGGTFTLNGDYKTKDGQQAIMTDSAYAYTLQKGGTNTPDDGNWYLVSQYDKPGPDPDCHKTNTCPPNPGRFSPAAPVYESYTATLQALNKLPTLQQRVGERYWGNATNTNGNDQPVAGETDSRAIWGRIEGAHNRAENGSTAGTLHNDIDTLIMRAGVDGQFYEGDNGRLIAGITGQYGNAHSDIDNRTGDGSGTIETQGWGLGATATWYGNSGFYLDAQAQANWYDSNLSVDAVNPTLKDGNKGFGYALSLEAGQRIAIDKNWSLTPQAQLMWSSVDFDTFNDTYGARISNRDGDSLTARLGLAANYANAWKCDDGLMVNTSVYGIANLYQELMGDARMNYAGTHMATYGDDTWGGIGAGGTYAWADNKYALYGEGSINTSLNHFTDSYALKGNVGFKARW